MTQQVPALRQRIRGQETEIRLIKDGVMYDTITKITKFSVEPMLEVKSQGFLGGTTEEKDDIFNGWKFSCEAQLDGVEWFDMQQAIIKRAQRLTPDVQFTIASTLYFPSGDTRIIVISDAKFSAAPIDIPERKDYVSVKLEGEVSNASIQNG